MKTIIPIISTWVKSHIVTTIVVSTVVVGGAVATPIIVNNVKESEPKVEEKQPIKEEVKQPEDSENIESPIEDKGEQPVEENKEQIKETQKPDNTTKPSTEKPNNNNNNNNETENTKPTQPQEEKQTGLSTSNHKVYYNGKEIVSFSVYTMKSYVGEYLPTPVYNANEISSLPSDMKQNLSKYVCEALNGYQGCYYNQATERNEIYHYVQQNNMNFYSIRQDRKRQIDDAEDCINYINSPQYQEDINNPNISVWTDETHTQVTMYGACNIAQGYTLKTWEKDKQTNEMYYNYIDEDERQFNTFISKTKVFYQLF